MIRKAIICTNDHTRMSRNLAWLSRRANGLGSRTRRALPTMGTGYRSGTTWLEHAEHPDLRPLRAVEQHRLASQAAGSAIELARCLRGLLTAEAAFAAYEWLRRPGVEMISGAAAKTSQAKAGKAAPGSGMPSPEQMFAPVRKHLIDWDAPAEA
jgi:hypothetical protein